MVELKEMDPIKEQYQYNMSGNEELIIDKPSKPLTKKNKKVKDDIKNGADNDIKIEADNTIETVEKIEKKIEKKIMKDEIKSNKEIYESYIKDLKYFSLTINNVVLYDSSIDKNVISPLIFDDNYFILYGKKYSYNGLKIQKK